MYTQVYTSGYEFLLISEHNGASTHLVILWKNWIFLNLLCAFSLGKAAFVLKCWNTCGQICTHGLTIPCFSDHSGFLSFMSSCAKQKQGLYFSKCFALLYRFWWWKSISDLLKKKHVFSKWSKVHSWVDYLLLRRSSFFSNFLFLGWLGFLVNILLVLASCAFGC